jgi:hypothetical protein
MQGIAKEPEADTEMEDIMSDHPMIDAKENTHFSQKDH